MLQERIEGKEPYLSLSEFAKRLNPPRSKARVLQLCKSCRVTGATKNDDGEWELPVSSLKQVEADLNPARDKYLYHIPKGSENDNKTNRRLH